MSDELPSFLPGTLPMYYVKQPAPEYTQGCDIVVEVPLTFQGQPLIDITNWKIKTYVKKSLKAENVLWKAGMDKWMTQKPGTNIFYFRIPHCVSSNFLPGSYYFAVIGHQKIATGEGFDARANLASGMFDINLDAGSPHPKLSTYEVVAFVTNDQDLTWAALINTTEPTEPDIEVSGGGFIP